jgi:hypothetical protein
MGRNSNGLKLLKPIKSINDGEILIFYIIINH